MHSLTLCRLPLLPASFSMRRHLPAPILQCRVTKERGRLFLPQCGGILTVAEACKQPASLFLLGLGGRPQEGEVA